MLNRHFYRFILRLTSVIVIIQMAVLMPLAPVLAQSAEAPSSTDPVVLTPTPPDTFSPEITVPATASTTPEPAAPVVDASSTIVVTVVPSAEASSTPTTTNSDLPPSTGEIIYATPAPIATNTPAPAKPDFLLNTSTPPVSYAELMRTARDIRANKGDRVLFNKKLTSFVKAEKERLNKLGVSGEKQDAYFALLNLEDQGQAGAATTSTDGNLFDQAKNFVKNLFKSKSEKSGQTPVTEEDRIKIPDRPGVFKFGDEANISVGSLAGALEKQPANAKFLELFKSAFSAPFAIASVNDLPTLADVTSDGSEVTISPEIVDLAQSLNNNPVKILNYVRKNISYEPYFGAKKGSTGCLVERVCNDVDSSSLLVALLRAAGIPARYKKSIAVFPVAQLNQLLGVDQTKSAFAALALNKVPVYTLSNVNDGKNLNTADFSQETELAVQWVFVEAFYDYGEQGGNINNLLNFSSASTTSDVQTALSAYPAKQWIPMDAVVKPHNRQKNEIVADTAAFDSQSFWNNYFKYSGALSPVEKYASDLKSATGKDITLAAYQSSRSVNVADYPYLPPTLPYYTRTGQVGGSLIQPEAWSTLPDLYKQSVTITLKKQSDNTVVFSQVFNGSQINNQELNLRYVGATTQDQQIIDSYGGIAETPAALVSIIPELTSDSAVYSGTGQLAIGDALILEFSHTADPASTETDQKFSVAGNEEGIFISLSSVQDNPNEDTPSHILLAGNAAIARAYLKHLQTSGLLLKSSLDYSYNQTFARAVVTQNRVLSRVNGTPTTFDFQGLSIDASTYINDYSNRGDYQNHRRDFRLLWGQDASAYEAQIFTDIAGLDGISTAKGLQYANAHPADYTVLTISSSTPNYTDVVNGLALTNNTKTNLLADIAAGNTIITPNKFVTSGVWSGILYVSLRPDSTGNYAIGEQVANGGWTISPVVYKTLVSDVNNQVLGSYQVDNVSKSATYIYRDKFKKAVQCNIKTDTFIRIIANIDVNGQPIPSNSEAYWRTSYGWPCIDDNPNGPYSFGNYNHYFIVATDGAKFYSPGRYNYWRLDQDLEFEFKKVYHYYNGLPQSQCTYPMEWRNGLCFIAGGDYDQTLIKTYWGTYVYEDLRKAYQGDSGTTFGLGVYNPEQRKVYNIPGEMYKKYVSSGLIQNKYVPNLLGYPTGDSKLCPNSAGGGSGDCQTFINGGMYLVKGWFSDSAYVVYGPWYDKFIQVGGVGGIGLPQEDVGYSVSNGGVVTQKFELKTCKDEGAINCYDRSFWGDVNNGLETYYDSFGMAQISLTLSLNKSILPDYQNFVANIDSASASDAGYFCRLYWSSYSNSLDSNKRELAFNACLWPQDIGWYKNRKFEIQNNIANIISQNASEISLAASLSDSIATKVQNSTYSPAEWLGYFAVDLGLLIIAPAADIGATAAEEISKRVALRYMVELEAGNINRSLLLSAVKQATKDELVKAGGKALTDEALDELADQTTIKAAKLAGSRDFTVGGNPIEWSLEKNSFRKQITTLANGGKNILTDFGLSTGRFETAFNNDGSEWVIKQAFKVNVQDQRMHASAVILDQFQAVFNKAPVNVTKITLDTIINEEAIKLVETEGKQAFAKSGLADMVNYILKPTGKTVQQIIVGDMVNDPNIIGGKYFNVTYILK